MNRGLVRLLLVGAYILEYVGAGFLMLYIALNYRHGLALALLLSLVLCGFLLFAGGAMMLRLARGIDTSPKDFGFAVRAGSSRWVQLAGILISLWVVGMSYLFWAIALSCRGGC